MCAGQDSNLRSPKAIDLQSIAIDRSATGAVPILCTNCGPCASAALPLRSLAYVEGEIPFAVGSCACLEINAHRAAFHHTPRDHRVRDRGEYLGLNETLQRTRTVLRV